ncbi:MAG TPA: TIGR03067 domain-containing protein [Gemmataceae bacterium]|jgi:uncharacterized protein (TIGR03067 family)|nr:TIGR03067 domain-containing protein [Gemmataceae bacterium]
MSRVICLLLFLGLPAAFAGADTDPSAKDLEAMQGDWAVIEYVADGVKSEDDNAQSLFRTIKGDHYTVFLFDKPLGSGTIKLDTTHKPKTIDSIPDKMPGKPFLGIYEIDGNRIKVCYAPPGKDRPTEFVSKKGSEHTFTIWEREKK